MAVSSLLLNEEQSKSAGDLAEDAMLNFCWIL
jgi:hypothetical protein